MATGKAPISGSLAIVCGVLAVATLVIAISGGVSWNAAVSAFTTFTMFIIVWRGMKKHDREYQERLSQLNERLGQD